jgi:phenylacetate-CoA ligase
MHVVLKDNRGTGEAIRREIELFDPATPNPYLQNTLNHARQNVPHYREVYRDFAEPSRCFGQLPFLMRQVLQDKPTTLLAQNSDLVRCHTMRTSGSTSDPVTIYADNNQKNWVRSTEKHYFQKFLGVDPNDEPSVVIWSSAADVWGRKRDFRKKFSLWLTRTVLLGASRITPAEFADAVHQINSRRPTFIKSYASCLYELARHIRLNRLRIHSPRFIVSTAETLLPHMRDTVQDVFGAEVFDFYGTRETGPIAGQCRNGKLHVFSYQTHLEVLDEADAPVLPGARGRTVATTLHNRAMPLIRYELSDIATVGKPCSCGCKLAVLDHIDGRVYDYFPARDGTLVYAGYFARTLYSTPWIRDYRIVQTALDEICLTCVPSHKPSHDEIRFVEDRIRLVMGKDCRVSWDLVETIPPTAAGKRLYAVSLVNCRSAPTAGSSPALR